MSLAPNAVAVVGMAGRFPGADSVSTFWDNLRRGEESIVDLSEGELIAAGVGQKALAAHSYVRRAAVMERIDEFDCEFFGFTPQAARLMDPQHRLFLQCAWHALEDAGYDPAQTEGSVGVYATSSASGYLLYNLMSHHDPRTVIGQGASFDMVNLSLHNDKDHLATRVSHQLNLRGPALSVQTACSSSLVAVHLACQSVLNGECDMALAGGASIRVPHRVGYWHEPGSMVSATGHCRPFDVRSDGTIFGSGVGIVVLKTLTAAVDDGDRIHAVIRGSAINNDGSTKMNYAAPSAAGQAEAIAEAHVVADIDASTVSYVETHGTGTPLGDPIEIEGLRQAFEISTASRPGPCFVGSVKSNIGHLEAASGIAGLIKAILCLKHRALPATLHFTRPNPELHLDRGPFVVRSAYGPWEWDGVRRAGVSSFGVGGTNAHVVLEEAPALSVPESQPGPQVLLLSARTVDSLNASRAALAAALSGEDVMRLPDVAYTLSRRRKETIRMAAVVGDQQHAAALLGSLEDDNVFVGESVRTDEPDRQRVVFLFPGQGAQHAGMARGLYESEPVFADHFDQCAAAFADELGIDLRAEVFDGTARSLERTDRAQPALFAVEFALTKLLDSYGVRPAALAGHSIGEYVAAAVAGVFDLRTVAKAVSVRARLMHAASRGVMIAVALSPEAIAEYLTPDVDIATINDPGSCVIAGSEKSIGEFSDRLAREGIIARRVRTSHAFHSRMMDPVIPEFTGFLSGLTLHEPQLPLLSNITGTWMSADDATDPSTWARQIRATVRFSDELDTLLAHPSRVLIEVGPGGSLTSSAMRHPRWSSQHRAIRLMRHQAQNRTDRDTFLLGLGQLSAAGIDVDWTPLWADHQPRLISLPGYPFVRQRHWIEHNANSGWSHAAPSTNGKEAGTTPTVSGDSHAATDGKSNMETTLQRIWGQCLGVDSIDRHANFFELGGDSLIAISVAMTAANEGLEFTPQDLYENQSVAALAKALTERYGAGGLSRMSVDDLAHPPIPANIAHFLDRGLREPGRWRLPVLLRVRADVELEDVRAVLTAVVNHHDALRLQISQRAGIWQQHVGEPQELIELATRSLPDGLVCGSPQERQELLKILDEQINGQDLSSPALTAAYIRGVPGGTCYLAISMWAIVADNASRDVLLTDILTAFAQRLTGDDIALQPVATSWSEWSQRCAALAAHPAVIESSEFWLKTAARATVRVASSDASERPQPDDLMRLQSTLSVSETAEIDDARRKLRSPIDEILLAALGRTIAAIVGAGAVAVDLGGSGRSVLKPDVDLRRTVGWFTTIYPTVLDSDQDHQSSARRVLDDVHDSLKAVPHNGIGYGLLRYVYGPTTHVLGAVPPADILFSYVGTIPDLPLVAADEAPIQLDGDTAMPVRDALPGLGHALELRVYRIAGALHVDWWYDTRRLEPTRAESIARHYPTALLELIRRALAEDDVSADDELALVDLSSMEST
ncbi:polyketide synthase [Mycolicibacterium agri]|uniref:Polyketide synthase n=1 Tax=Mycolicibacterium agri TaxID=36811 RepID=A0A2A7MS17_MYCAG|nr:type I polyketide synthase [Mycolicibacterium agri]PEG34525.1 polyketide synthase [Mycolicibacterium agri]